MDNYYVYVYLDPRKPISDDPNGLTHEPFYVGKGVRRRMYDHMTELEWYLTEPSMAECKARRSNLIKLNKLRKLHVLGLRPIIVQLHTKLASLAAEEKEVELIAFYRRSIDGGILSNLTPGGAGRRDVLSAGPFNSFYGKTHSDEFRVKMSKLHKGKVISQAQRDAISLAVKGKPKPHHMKEALRATLVRRNLDDPLHPSVEAKRLARSKLWEVTSPNGEVTIVRSLRRFCEEQGLPVKTLMSAKNRGEPVASGPALGWRVRLL
jgi:hypothetical protein